jgi:hypothetical protein
MNDFARMRSARVAQMFIMLFSLTSVTRAQSPPANPPGYACVDTSYYYGSDTSGVYVSGTGITTSCNPPSVTTGGGNNTCTSGVHNPAYVKICASKCQSQATRFTATLKDGNNPSSPTQTATIDVGATDMSVNVPATVVSRDSGEGT